MRVCACVVRACVRSVGGRDGLDAVAAVGSIVEAAVVEIVVVVVGGPAKLIGLGVGWC